MDKKKQNPAMKGMARLGQWERRKVEEFGKGLKHKWDVGQELKQIEQKAFEEEAKKQAKKKGVARARAKPSSSPEGFSLRNIHLPDMWGNEPEQPKRRKKS